MSKHTHKAQTTKTHGWLGCVNPDDCDGVTHGNVTVVETCACGAERKEERNGGRSVAGEWSEENAAILSAAQYHGVWCVNDKNGGTWWPSDEARTEIDAAISPSLAAVRICESDPSRGEWHT